MILLPVVVCINLIILGLLVSWFWTYYNYYKYLKTIPASRIWPLVGNALDFLSKSEILDSSNELFTRYETKTIRIHMGYRLILYTTDPDMIEFVLCNRKLISKSSTYKFFYRWLGDGLLTSSGKKWHNHRKLITPTFHFEILGQFISIFNSKANLLITKLSNELDKSSFDIYPYISLCALDIICETAMGTCVNAQNETTSKYVQAVKKMGSIIPHRSVNPLYHNEFLYKFSNLYKEEISALKILHNYSKDIIKRKRQNLLTQQVQKITNLTDNNSFRTKKKIAFLDMLLQADVNGQSLTDNEIREEVDTFMFEGHDTIAAAISFAIYNLAHHPEYQKKICDELKELFGTDKELNFTIQNLQKMKYLELVIKETLRLYPSVPIFSRRTTENINYKGIIIPKDVTIGIYAFGLQRDPEFFDQPEKFLPERFLDGENNHKHRLFSYIPFSAGSRNCIGQKFAMLEMKCILSKILRNFELKPASPVHHLHLSAQSTLKSTNGVKIAIILK